ncbi:ATP-binding protein [Cochlodiniinecator piscidefendens]|uniref:ATP-binding protein n=1 Tax=Cochlodiniinecator piscidefendens TaxID=2715756 RepID=UPI00140BB682|nr:ATP-binding protein [Cochlodiniinecator piscidefendens]
MALALLSLATLLIGAVTWVSLERVDKRLQELHRQTLSEVALALNLSKRSTDLATSAPYLLNQRSNFLINQEGQNLISALSEVRSEWPAGGFGTLVGSNVEVASAIQRIADGVGDLVAASSRLETIQSELHQVASELSRLRRQAAAERSASGTPENDQIRWWGLQSMTTAALNAVVVGNQIGVGEERRRFANQHRELNGQELTDEQQSFLMQIVALTEGNDGLFEQRRHELSANLSAQNALFRIRFDAGHISELASVYAQEAERYLADERSRSSSMIQLVKAIVVGIALASLAVALVSAIYVSRYVTFNIARVSAAMVRLASGDRSSVLPRHAMKDDEIGDLLRSFRSFRANALRLDRSNRQLNQRNTLFQKVFVNISDGVAIADSSGRLTAVNRAFSKMLGQPRHDNGTLTLIDLLKSSPFEQAAQGLAHDHRGFCELQGDDGKFIEMRASRLPDDGRVWLCSDVTERRQLIERLQQIDRIETLGKMAGDTAHDFANVLSSINTHAHLMEREGATQDRPALNAIIAAVEYGTSLTQRLLAFAKKQQLTPEVVDLNLLVAGLADLIEISLKPNVELNIRYSDNPIFISVDPGQLESTLFNLILNSNNAIADIGQINVLLDCEGTKEAIIRVSDTGSGMSPEVLKRAVEPFYTTRHSEGGTGLGLSIVYGFIKQTGGDVQISSKPGQGTTITLTLPVVADVSEVLPCYENHKVLLVEDDERARKHAFVLLETCGFIVDQAVNVQEAKRLISLNSYDLLLTDIDLGPGPDGWELVRYFLELFPSRNVVVVSGRAQTVDHLTTENQQQVMCLPKPLSLETLSQTLQIVQC